MGRVDESVNPRSFEKPQSPGNEVMTTWRDLPRPGVVKQHPFQMAEIYGL